MTNSKSKQNNSREIVQNMLIETLEQGKFSHIVLSNTLKKYQYLRKQERAFISRVFMGSIESHITLDYIIDEFSSLPVKKMKPLIRNLLRLSVYQIFKMDQVPDSAACNEAVKIVKKGKYKRLSGFVNGVLRNIARNKDNIKFPDIKKSPSEYLSVIYSTPKWLVDQMVKQYGFETAELIFASSLEEKGVTIRCNKKKISPQQLVKQLEEEKVTWEKSDLLDYAFTISEYDYLDKLPSFNQGLFAIQDVSSMLVCEVADIKDTDYIIDVCAAPGGKAIHAAEKARFVSARDLTQEKIDYIEENILRMDFDNIKTKVWDARKKDDLSIEKADIVIADLPCSGLGILSKKPDIKYKLTKKQQSELVVLQRQMLDLVKNYVKPGGLLIYSTCTINKEENIVNRDWFLNNNKNFQAESLDEFLPKALHSETTVLGYLQLVQGIHQTDGFFLAKMRKNK
mgnify:CR=1 FL=1